MPRRNIRILIAMTVIALLCASQTSPHLRVLGYALRRIQDLSLKEHSREELFEGAVTGMVEQLDPFSGYVPPDKQQQFKEDIEQKFAGIGIQVDQDRETKQLLVVCPLHGSPAQKAGIQAGDIILEIDGVSTQGLSFSDANDLLRGKPGDPVVLTVRHRDEQDPVEIEIVRDIILIETVVGDWRHQDGSYRFTLETDPAIGYLKISSFSDQTPLEVRQAVAQLLDEGMKGLILDLRDNPGGFMPSAVQTCDMFLESGEIVSTRRRGGVIKDRYVAYSKNTFPDFPLVILINDNSASAAEILAACLQDNDRATVVGQRSFGKGTVQELLELPYQLGTLKLTIAKYWRPGKANIHRDVGDTEEDEWGVRPDPGFEVALEEPLETLVRQVRLIRSSVPHDDLKRPVQEALELYEDAREQHASEKTEAETSSTEFDEKRNDTRSEKSDEKGEPDASESPDPGAVDAMTPLSELEAPYYDPQLQRAIDHLRKVDSPKPSGEGET